MILDKMLSQNKPNKVIKIYKNKGISNFMLRKSLVLFLVVSFLLIMPIISATPDFFFKQNDAAEIPIPCIQEDESSCPETVRVNLTITKSDGTIFVGNALAEYVERGNYRYNLSAENTSEAGVYTVNSNAENAGGTTFGFGIFEYEVTSSGRATPVGVPNLLIGIVIMIFLSSFFFLLLAIKIQEPGPKIFFLLVSFVIVAISIFLAVNVAQDSNVSEGVSSTLGTLSLAFAMIMITIFAWIFIKQTVNAINMLKIRKGLAWDGHPDMAGRRNYRIPGMNMDPFGK